jgi:SAM-dependent methyltransferase
VQNISRCPSEVNLIMPIFLDHPPEVVSGRTFPVVGWVAGHSAAIKPIILVDGSAIPYVLHERPDVTASDQLSNFAYKAGFTTNGDVTTFRHAGSAEIEVIYGSESARRLVTVAPLSETHIGSHALATKARQWVQFNLRCTQCQNDCSTLSPHKRALVCSSCGYAYPQTTGAINMLPADAGITADLTPTANISSNPYTPDALALIEATTARGGWVLDCGAGSRPSRLPNVVNLEIVDYASTDVLSIGERLPFKSNSFDAVLSLAVLEHVRDPFLCAQEIMRVLKPGGELRADVPFLQPSHGYPHHYYNMTQQGLCQLFAVQGDVLECRVPLHGHPIFAVQWLLSRYLLGLPPAARHEFAQMTIGAAASLEPHSALAQPFATELPSADQEIIACLNTVRVRKKYPDQVSSAQ